MPSFGGRAPAIATQRLKQINGNGVSCTLVYVYGNLAYEDTLAEMEGAAKACGFRCRAAIAAVAEHSIISKYATNRPDESDEAQLTGLAEPVLQKDGEATSIPGNRHYKKGGGGGLVPKTTKGCAKYALCAEKCPVQAIDPETLKADSKKRISCMRCVKQCPHEARKVSRVMVSAAALAMKKACSVWKENELFL